MSAVNIVNGARWTTEETNFLLNAWSSDDIQSQIEGTVRDAEVYRVLAQKLLEGGYHRSSAQVKTRIKVLKKLYRAQKNKKDKSKSSKTLFRYYKQIDRVLGGRRKDSSPPGILEEEVPIKIEYVHSLGK